MNELNDVEAMRELLNRLREKLGDDWADSLADAMNLDERTALSEALQKSKPE